MRFVKPSPTLIAALALWVACGPAAFAQAKPAPAPKATETPKAAPPAKQAAAPTQIISSKAPAKVPAQPQAKAPAKVAAKSPAKAVAKAPTKAVKHAPIAKAPAKTAAKAPAAKAATQASTAHAAPASKRDPFQPLVSKTDPGKMIPDNLPPGPGGLMVSTLRVDGIVRSQSGMIAVISSPQQRVYFIREGAALYDGTVEKIALDAVTFRERGKDPFGKPVDRQVVKRLYPRAGEQ